MKIATWNVNSIKARLDHVAEWIGTAQPDVLMIQELKGEIFPSEPFSAIGYNVIAHGQKTYNGVATLSRGHTISVETCELPGDESDDQARYLETIINGIRFINIYLPNGNPVDSDKFPYKLRWMARLKDRVAYLRSRRDSFVLAGDFNVIPDAVDCHNPAQWWGDALFRPETLSIYRAIMNLGLVDAFRALHGPQPGQYTFWDYQAGAWQKNNGIRIDHIMLAPSVADRLVSASIDRAPRGKEKASDHTPLIVTID